MNQSSDHNRVTLIILRWYVKPPPRMWTLLDNQLSRSPKAGKGGWINDGPRRETMGRILIDILCANSLCKWVGPSITIFTGAACQGCLHAWVSLITSQLDIHDRSQITVYCNIRGIRWLSKSLLDWFRLIWPSSREITAYTSHIDSMRLKQRSNYHTRHAEVRNATIPCTVP